MRALLLALAIAACAPGEEPKIASDNLWCNLDGSIRASFAFEGGDCRCDCDGVPYPLECTISSTVAP